jgi:CubicO group peptidase (beta-lactamase class C family)
LPTCATTRCATLTSTWLPAIALGLGLALPLCADPFLTNKLAAMDTAILQAIADQKCPGGVLWLERDGQRYHNAYGERAVEPAHEPMTGDTIFDAASLTKVVATAPSIMMLIERGQVELDAPVQTYIAEFTSEGRDAVTVRHLLTHTSGLPPGISTKGDWRGPGAALERACAAELKTKPGEAFRYSDINYILLGEIVQRVSKTPLQTFVQKHLYEPLRMSDTGYLPPAEKRSRIAPTERVEGEVLRGVVHDPTARKMGGVAGHAGLFLTAPDLARYARMLLNEGELDGARVMKPETVRLMTTVQSPAGVEVQRGLGWDIRSSYSGPRGEVFPHGSFGHTGWTGTSIWIDPASDTFVIFLSNRNHPTEDGTVLELRKVLGTLAAEAVGLSRPSAEPTAADR